MYHLVYLGTSTSYVGIVSWPPDLRVLGRYTLSLPRSLSFSSPSPPLAHTLCSNGDSHVRIWRRQRLVREDLVAAGSLAWVDLAVAGSSSARYDSGGVLHWFRDLYYVIVILFLDLVLWLHLLIESCIMVRMNVWYWDFSIYVFWWIQRIGSNWAEPAVCFMQIV